MRSALTTLFAALVLLMAAQLALAPRMKAAAGSGPPGPARNLAAGAGIGAVSALAGIGGGIMKPQDGAWPGNMTFYIDVADLVTDELTSMVLVAGDDRVRVEHTDGQWSLVEPVRDLADQDHIRNLVSDLNSLRVEDFVDSTVASTAFHSASISGASGDGVSAFSGTQ